MTQVMSRTTPVTLEAVQAAPPAPLSILTAGLINGVLTATVSVSFASLIFTDDLSRFLPSGIGLALLSTTIMLVITSLLATIPGTIGVIQDSPAAVLGIVAASVAVQLGAATGDTLLFTVVGAVGFATVLTGLFFLIMGTLRLGGFIRFIPYPVVGGFLAGTGLLIMRGAIGVMIDVSLDPASLTAALQFGGLIRWLPGILFGIVLLILVLRINHYLVLPLTLAGAVVLFYVVVLASGMGLAGASERGLLLGPFPSNPHLEIMTLPAVTGANWAVVTGQAGGILSVALVSVIGLLLNASAFEVSAHADVDFDKELRAAGIGNILSGLAGGMPGFPTLSLSALCQRIGAGSRLTGLVAAAICAALLLLGIDLISYLPRMVMGGLLFFLGLAFLVEWVYDSWFRLPHAEYLVIILILAAIVSLGYLAGVGVGIFLAVVLFIAEYSRVNVVKQVLSGSTYRSTVERTPEANQVLKQLGGSILILRLQGYMFFGTANSLLARVQARLNDRQAGPLKYLVLDFRLVTGVDTSAAMSLAKIRQMAETGNFFIVLCTLSAGSLNQLKPAGFGQEDVRIHLFQDLDHGVEWCEEHIFRSELPDVQLADKPIAEHLKKMFADRDLADRLMTYLVREEFDIGDYLTRLGAPSEDMYFIESGRLSAFLDFGDGRTMRLRVFGGGAIVGEISMYLKEPRSASIRVRWPTVAYRLSAGSMLRMGQQDPELASAFHQTIAQLLAHRLSGINQTLDALME